MGVFLLKVLIRAERNVLKPLSTLVNHCNHQFRFEMNTERFHLSSRETSTIMATETAVPGLTSALPQSHDETSSFLSSKLPSTMKTQFTPHHWTQRLTVWELVTPSGVFRKTTHSKSHPPPIYMTKQLMVFETGPPFLTT